MIAPKLLVIGGSAGSFEHMQYILQRLCAQPFSGSIMLVIHRMKMVNIDISKILQLKAKQADIIEASHGDEIEPNRVYIAPVNYHMIVEEDKTIALDYSETVNYSRPSIDMLFETAAQVYGSNLTAILLSGANKDGAEGIGMIYEKKGTCYIQSLEEAEYDTMPAAGIKEVPTAFVGSVEQIVDEVFKKW